MSESLLARLRSGIVTGSAEETRSFAEEFGASLRPDCTVALHGDLGVGKTTFVQGLARGLGIPGSITSPTYTVYTMHRAPAVTLVHLDGYRIESPGQADALMLDDFLVSPYVLAIEWPERVPALVPPDAIHVQLGIAPDERHTIRLR